MRLLQVIDDLDVGGAETLLVDLCLRWKANGLSPEIFLLRNGGQAYRARLEGAGIPVTVSPHTRLHSPGHAKELAKFIAQNRFDLVHVHLFPAQLWAAMALRMAPNPPPAITTEHSTWNRRRDHRWYGPMDRWMYSQFRLAVCIGSAAQDSFQGWLGSGICPTCVVANGIDLARFHPDVQAADLPATINGVATVLCVGNLRDYKDQETLVRAIAEVEDVHVLLVGDGPLRQRTAQVAKELGVGDRIHFLGVRHDVAQLIAAADVYVQPSKVDGFCIAVLEAMAGGLPVIVSNIPGLRDLVADCGIL